MEGGGEWRYISASYHCFKLVNIKYVHTRGDRTRNLMKRKKNG